MDNLNFGVIGNCQSAALINNTGGIEWCCLPNFGSPSVFASLLDKDRGGKFEIIPVGDYKIEQCYIRKTNILCTRFSKGEDIFELRDFMPRYKHENGSYHCPPDIMRYVHHVSGNPKIRVNYDPRLNYSKHETKHDIQERYIKSITNGKAYESIYLYSDLDLADIHNGKEVVVDRDRYFILSYNQKIGEQNIDHIRLEYERTKVYWMSWVSRTSTFGKYDEQIQRSALVLKMLAYQKTGAILAAVTTSLPETIGEVRNWDYRYCWMRDSSMTINMLVRLGHFNVSKRFLQFILDAIPYKDEKMQIMYGIHNEKRLTEKTLDWLDGYEGSKPVRVGNAAWHQKQNDIYGVVMDVIYQSLCYFRHHMDNEEDIWTVVRTLARHVEKNWARSDHGIWESRSERKHFTFSKILCWVAMDRAVKIAGIFGMETDAAAWIKLRDKIKRDILKKGYNREMGALTQYYGGCSLDAANLLAEHYGFLDSRDPIYVNTVMQTYEQLCVDGLMYRYRNADDFGVPQTSFTICTFWMIRALARIGRVHTAEELFENLLGHSNHLGLFSEDMDFKTKRLLGNFPQGYSHLALIDTAIVLAGVDDRVEDISSLDEVARNELEVTPGGVEIQSGI